MLLLGKTNFIRNLIDQFGEKTFAEILIITKSADQPLYVDLKESNSKVQFLEEVPSLDEFEAQQQRLIIFDDMMEDSSLREIKTFWTRGRHKKFSCVFATQMFFQLDQAMRLNSDYVAVLGFGGGRDASNTLSDICPDADKAIVMSFFNHCKEVNTLEALLIYKQNPLSRRFRCGFASFFDYPPTVYTPLKNQSSAEKKVHAVEAPISHFHSRQAKVQQSNEKGEVIRDLYETPANATKALTDALFLNDVSKDALIWECCAGNSAMTKVFREAGYHNLIESDLFPSSDEMLQLDFYVDKPNFFFDYIITNPPYDQKERFLKQCLSYGRPFALLLPLEALKNKFFRELGTRIQLLILNDGLKFKKEDGKEVMIPIVAWFFIDFDVLIFHHSINCGIAAAFNNTVTTDAVIDDVDAEVTAAAVDTDVDDVLGELSALVLDDEDA